MLILFRWRKHQNKSCNIRCTGKVKTTVADSSFQFGFIKIHLAFVPLLHRHPTHRLFYPLIQTQLSKSIFFTGSFLCRITRSYHLIHTDSFIKAWVCFFPDLWVSPVLRFIRTINDRIKSRVMFSAFQNILRFLVDFIAD